MLGKKKLNYVGHGMWPLNYCSRLVKEASDVMFSVAANDATSVDARLEMLERYIADLRKSISSIC